MKTYYRAYGVVFPQNHPKERDYLLNGCVTRWWLVACIQAMYFRIFKKALAKVQVLEPREAVFYRRYGQRT